MDTALVLLLLVIVLGLVFEFVNGFHDAANAIATIVATRVLAPTTAVLMAGSPVVTNSVWSLGKSGDSTRSLRYQPSGPAGCQ